MTQPRVWTVKSLEDLATIQNPTREDYQDFAAHVRMIRFVLQTEIKRIEKLELVLDKWALALPNTPEVTK